MFLRTKVGRRRAWTVQWFESRLRALTEAFGDREMDAVSRADFRGWVAAMEVSEGTRAGYVRAARALWRWAAAQEPPMAGASPTEGMASTAERTARTVGFLSVAEARAVMEHAGEWRAALALMLFAGLRVEEVAGAGKPRLSWRCVDVVGKSIRVPAECAKTGRARLIEGLPDAVWAWLGAPGGDAEAVCPGKAASAVVWAKRWVERWPVNGLRHTFATHALALTGEPDRVAGWLGHEEGSRLLRAHYAGLARRAEGEAYFALRPGK